MTMTMAKTKADVSESEVRAVYRALFDGFYQLPADQLKTIPVQDMEFASRQGAIAIFNRRGIAFTEEEILAIVG
jgi:hypothetical protein